MKSLIISRQIQNPQNQSSIFKPIKQESFVNNFQGKNLQKEKKYDKSIDYFKKAVNISPHYAEAYYNMGNSYDQMGKNKEAIKCYEEALKYNPQYIDACENLAIAFRESKKYQQALECYQKLIGIDKQSSYAFYNMGITLFCLKKYNEAIKSFERSLTIQPKNAKAYYNIAKTYKKVKDNQKAIKNYEQAIKINPFYDKAYHNMALVYLDIDQQEKAIKCLKEAIKINPKDHRAHFNLGCIYQDDEKLETAEAQFNYAIELNPYSPIYYSERAILFLMSNRTYRSKCDIVKSMDLLTLGQNQDLHENVRKYFQNKLDQLQQFLETFQSLKREKVNETLTQQIEYLEVDVADFYGQKIRITFTSEEEISEDNKEKTEYLKLKKTVKQLEGKVLRADQQPKLAKSGVKVQINQKRKKAKINQNCILKDGEKIKRNVRQTKIKFYPKIQIDKRMLLINQKKPLVGQYILALTQCLIFTNKFLQIVKQEILNITFQHSKELIRFISQIISEAVQIPSVLNIYIEKVSDIIIKLWEIKQNGVKFKEFYHKIDNIYKTFENQEDKSLYINTCAIKITEKSQKLNQMLYLDNKKADKVQLGEGIQAFDDICKIMKDVIKKTQKYILTIKAQRFDAFHFLAMRDYMLLLYEIYQSKESQIGTLYNLMLKFLVNPLKKLQ